MHFKMSAINFPITDEKVFWEKTKGVYLKSNTANVDNLKGVIIFDYQ